MTAHAATSRLAAAGLVALACACCPPVSRAQTSASGVIAGAFDRVAKSADATSDSGAAPVGTFDLEHFAFGERLRVFYTMDGGTFSDTGDWHYMTHYGGVRHAFDLRSDVRVFVGGSATVRVNGDSWSNANYNAVGAFSNLQWSRNTASFRTGVRLDARRFAGESALDQNEVNVFASGMRSFQTRTTVVGEVTWGAKRFTNGALVAAMPTTSTGGTTDLAYGAVSGSTSPGNGQGNSGTGNVTSPGGGAGAAMSGAGALQQGTWRMSMATPVTTSSSNELAQQVTVFGRVAQSLADRVAVSLEASHRNAGGVVAPAVVETPEMLIDDGVYDDPYASDATIWRAGVKFAGANGRSLDTGFSHWSKFYEATPALDSAGAPIPGVQRDDQIWRVDFTWREPIAPGRTGLVSLALVTSYSFMDSASTDAYYTYDAHRLRVGLAISY